MKYRDRVRKIGFLFMVLSLCLLLWAGEWLTNRLNSEAYVRQLIKDLNER